ncbi:MAG TPA: YegP family protein [Micromonosporaceae bacterium]|nr:YegP family protein [Micromonosporaceae bacterium]
MKFQIKKTSNDQYRFNLIASNGQVLATSGTYTRKQSAKDTIGSIRHSAAATVEDLAD